MAQDAQPRSKSGATVSVACKLPHGLLLRIHQMVEVDIPVLGGGVKTAKEARQLPGEVRINGNAHPQNAAPNCLIVAGYAITPGVNKEFWDRWLEQNKESDMVKNHLIFAHETSDATQGDAREKAAVKSNLERLDPKALPKGVAVENADELSADIKKKLAEA